MSRYFYILKVKYWSVIYTIFFRIKLFLFGVQFGEKIKSIGKTYIYKQKQSKIYIGKNCIFRSKEHSNLIGINRKCSISTIVPGSEISIGHHCGFSGTIIGAFSSIKIGNHVRCGANTLITDSDWHKEDSRSGNAKPVVIKDNVWLGVNVIVLKGVEIGENTIVGANSVVTKSLPSNAIAGGNPCKVIKKISS